MYSRFRLTLLYFIPIFLIVLLFAGGMFWYLSTRITNIDGVLREIAHTTRMVGSGDPEDNTILFDNYDPERVNKIISDADWEKLSMKEIDAKLIAHGEQPIGNQKSPTYTIRQSDIDRVISADEWNILSMKEIDAKLQHAGLAQIGDPSDPTYTLRPTEIDGQYVNMSYVSARQLEKMKDSMNLQFLFFIFGGFLLVLLALLGLSYLFALRSLKPLEQALEKQKQFVSDASHELRTPLALIQSGAEVLLHDKSATKSDYEDFAKNTISDIEHLSGLTTSLLALTKIDGKEREHIETVRIDAFVASLCERFVSLAEEKGLTLSCHADTPITIQTDPILLREILSIILDNAIKYTEQGSIALHTTSNKKQLQIIVQDTGIGIEKKHLSRIFDRFYRVTEDRHEKGYGLGLAIASEATNRLGGKLTARSHVGEGTEMMLVLPV